MGGWCNPQSPTDFDGCCCRAAHQAAKQPVKLAERNLACSGKDSAVTNLDVDWHRRPAQLSCLALHTLNTSQYGFGVAISAWCVASFFPRLSLWSFFHFPQKDTHSLSNRYAFSKRASKVFQAISQSAVSSQATAE